MIYCCGCNQKIEARLTNGEEIYPHRKDLYSLPFWKCDKCGNFVGCHHKTNNRTAPLGCIPTPEIKNARKEIHKLLDPIWMSSPDRAKNNKLRKEIYQYLSEQIGRKYHTAQIRSIEEARDVYRLIKARYARA